MIDPSRCQRQEERDSPPGATRLPTFQQGAAPRQ